MAIDCKSPCSPYKDEVQTVLDSLVGNRIKGAARDRWEQQNESSATTEDAESKVPAHQDDQHEFNASDLSQMTDDEDPETSFSSLNKSLPLGSLMSMHNSSHGGMQSSGSLYASMDNSTASFADTSTVEQTSRMSKAERKRNKRLNKKKEKYRMLASSNDMQASSNDSKIGFTLGDLISDIKAGPKEVEEKGEDSKQHHQSFPAPRGSASGVTLADLITDLQNVEKGDTEEENPNALNESFPAPRHSRGNSLEKSGVNDEEGRLPRASRSTRQSRGGGKDRKTSTSKRDSKGSLRRSKTLDDSDKGRVQARRSSLLNDDEKAKEAVLEAKKASRRRDRMEKSSSGKKLRDGLAAISAHASTDACPSDIRRKVKLRRAISDVGKLGESLDLSHNDDNNDACSKSDKKRSIKKAMSNLGKSQSRLADRSPVPVRMPSRRNTSSKRLPTTAVGSRIAGTKMGSLAAAAGVTPRASQSFSYKRPENKVTMCDLSCSVHGTSTTCASSRRALAAKLSQSERSLFVEDFDLSQTDVQPSRKSCSSCGREAKPPSSKDDLSRSVHGTSSTRSTSRRDRRSRASAATGSAPFDWEKFSS